MRESIGLSNKKNGKGEEVKTYVISGREWAWAEAERNRSQRMKKMLVSGEI